VSKWSHVPIEEVTDRVGSCAPSSCFTDVFPYLDIDAVDRESGEVRAAKMLPVAAAPSRARQIVAASDVIVSTVRPNLRQSAAIPLTLSGAIASTGFCVLRANAKLDPRFLFHFVRSDAFVQRLVRLCRGAQYPAVTDRDIRGMLIPLPSPDEQRRIAAALDRATRLVKLHKHAATKTRELVPSLFLQMFGDPATNPMGWALLPLSDVIRTVQGGKNVQAGDEATGRFRILKVSAVTTGTYREQESKPSPPEFEPPSQRATCCFLVPTPTNSSGRRRWWSKRTDQLFFPTSCGALCPRMGWSRSFCCRSCRTLTCVAY
jgi:type I restriction enzyme, S subunit